MLAPVQTQGPGPTFHCSAYTAQETLRLAWLSLLLVGQSGVRVH